MDELCDLGGVEWALLVFLSVILPLTSLPTHVLQHRWYQRVDLSHIDGSLDSLSSAYWL